MTFILRPLMMGFSEAEGLEGALER